MRLVLTGAVVPATRVVRANPDIRLADYRSAIALWLTCSAFTDIVYLDANGTSVLTKQLHVMAANLGKDVSEKRYELAAVAQQFGKGRSEAMMLDSIVESFDGPFYKVTGRLFVRNNETLLQQKDPIIFDRHASSVDTRFFKADAAWFRSTLTPRTSEISDNQRSTYIESIYFQANPGVPWRTRPRWVGYGASTGRQLG